MLSAAYAILGLKMIDGEIVVAPELFEAKGELQPEALRVGARAWRRDGGERAAAGNDGEPAETPAE